MASGGAVRPASREQGGSKLAAGGLDISRGTVERGPRGDQITKDKGQTPLLPVKLSGSRLAKYNRTNTLRRV